LRHFFSSFASGAIEAGCPEAAAAAVICFEWLQRPENVVGGYLTWPDYRPANFPHALRIVHHKTGLRLYLSAQWGHVAEWLRNGLQILLRPCRRVFVRPGSSRAVAAF
jgi:hypothetical protein